MRNAGKRKWSLSGNNNEERLIKHIDEPDPEMGVDRPSLISRMMAKGGKTDTVDRKAHSKALKRRRTDWIKDLLK